VVLEVVFVEESEVLTVALPVFWVELLLPEPVFAVVLVVALAVLLLVVLLVCVALEVELLVELEPVFELESVVVTGAGVDSVDEVVVGAGVGLASSA
jgi:hypothetical protein